MEVLANFLAVCVLLAAVGWGWARFLVPDDDTSGSYPLVAVFLGLVLLIWLGLWIQFFNLSYPLFRLVFGSSVVMSLGLALCSRRHAAGRPLIRQSAMYFVLALAAGIQYLLPLLSAGGKGLYTVNGGDLSMYLGVPRLFLELGSPAAVWSSQAQPPEVGWSFTRALAQPLIQPSLFGWLGLWMSICPPWTDFFSWYSGLMAAVYAFSLCGTAFLACTLFPENTVRSRWMLALLLISANGLLWVAMAHYVAHIVSVGVLGVMGALAWTVWQNKRVGPVGKTLWMLAAATMLVYYSALLPIYATFILLTCAPGIRLATHEFGTKSLRGFAHVIGTCFLAGILTLPGWTRAAAFFRQVLGAAVKGAPDVVVQFPGGWEYAFTFLGYVAPASLFSWNRVAGSAFSLPTWTAQVAFWVGVLLVGLGLLRTCFQDRRFHWGIFAFLLLMSWTAWSLRETNYRLMKFALYLLPFTLVLAWRALGWRQGARQRLSWCLFLGFVGAGLIYKKPLFSEAILGSEHSFLFGAADVEMMKQTQTAAWAKNNPLVLLSYDGFIRMAVMDTAFLACRYFTATTYTYKGPHVWEIDERIRQTPPQIQLVRKGPDILELSGGDEVFENRQWKAVRLDGAKKLKSFLVGPSWNAPLPMGPSDSFRWLRGKGTIGIWAPQAGRLELVLEVAPERNRRGCTLEVSSGMRVLSRTTIRQDHRYPALESIPVSVELERGFNWIVIDPQKLEGDELAGRPWAMVTRIETHFEPSESFETPR